jgi:hypothetical protein
MGLLRQVSEMINFDLGMSWKDKHLKNKQIKDSAIRKLHISIPTLLDY